MNISIVLLVAFAVGVVYSCVWTDPTCNCDFGHGCRGWTRRQNGTERQESCSPGYIVDLDTVPDTDNCSTTTTCKVYDAQPPCGVTRDCTGEPDGSYPELELACTFYYTCVGGIFFGHQYCGGLSPEGELMVFNNETQQCNRESETRPPCGTFVPSTTILPSTTTN